MKKHVQMMVAAVLALVISACGGYQQNIPPPPPKNAVITPDGGKVEVKGTAGTTLALDVPAGAVTQNIALKITPISGAAGRFKVEPAGVRLLKPATLSFTGSLPARAHFFWNNGNIRSVIPGTIQNNTLKSTVSVLGYPSGTVVSKVQKQAEGDTTLEVAVLDCTAEIADLENQIRNTINKKRFEEAIELHDRLMSVVQSCAETETVRLHARACDAYAVTLQNAQVLAASNQQLLTELLVPLENAAATVQALGAPCDLSGMGAVVDQKFDQFLNFLEAEFRKNSFSSDTQDHLQALKRLFNLHADCQLLSVGDAVCDRFPSSLFPDALDRLRQAAYQECVSRKTPIVLVRLYQDHFDPVRPVAQGSQSGPYFTHARYTYDDLEKDLSYCASDLKMQVFDDATTVPIEKTDQEQTLKAPATPGNYDTEAEFTLTFDGSITLSGHLLSPVCATGSFSNDQLVFRIAGQEIARKPASEGTFTINTSPADLLPSKDLLTAGQKQLLPSYTVVVQREGDGCGGLLSTEFPLYRLKINVLPPTLTVKPEGKTVSTGHPLKFEALFDTVTTTEVDWQTSGGTITPDGLFTAGPVAGSFQVRATAKDKPELTSTATVQVREDFSGIYSGNCRDISPVSSGPGRPFPCMMVVVHDPNQTQVNFHTEGLYTGSISNRKLRAEQSGELVFGNFTPTTFQGNQVESLNENDPEADRIDIQLNRAQGLVWTGSISGGLSSSIFASLNVTQTSVSGTAIAVNTLWTVNGNIAADNTLTFGLATGGDASVSFTGTINAERTSMSGTWRATSGPSNGKTGSFTLKLR